MFFHLLKYAAIVGVFLAFFVGIGVFLSPQDDLKEADLIIAISGGDTEARALEAIELYNQGYSEEILFSGAALDPLSPSNAEVMRNIARAQGVPQNVIMIEEESANTQENAEESNEIIDENIETVILVTSPYHQRRAYIEFQDALGDNVEVINHSATDESWSKKMWWVNPYNWYLTVSELVKIPISLIR